MPVPIRMAKERRPLVEAQLRALAPDVIGGIGTYAARRDPLGETP
jgi:hypothetical protein